jgi:mannose/cellobiose epimerase-like protein (N-acyl-D-glucosamine 2-epimerase family)
MVQARQIYVFAHAAQLGWFPEGAQLAEAARASLIRNFYTSSGRQASFAFRDPQRRPDCLTDLRC